MWSLLAMVAYAFTVVCRLRENRDHPAPEGLMALTCNEIARRMWSTRWLGRCSDAPTRRDPEHATRADKPPANYDTPELQVE